MVSKFSETVQKEEHLFSLRKYLKLKLNCSQKEVQNLIESGFVYIDQRKETFGSKKLKRGQRVHFTQQDTPTKSSKTPSQKIEIIWQNDELLAVNKPPGIPSQKTKDAKRYSMEHWAKEQSNQSLYLTHRLDRDTSGVLLFAKSKAMETLCFDWFKHRKVQKVYHAIAYGKSNKTQHGHWRHHLGEDQKRGGRSCFKVVRSGGLRAETDFKLIKNIDAQTSFWELKPHTGRTHQLRVQLAYEGHPIIGDDLYDSKHRQRKPTPHHFLHARSLLLPDDYPGNIVLSADYPKSWCDHWPFLKTKSTK